MIHSIVNRMFVGNGSSGLDTFIISLWVQSPTMTVLSKDTMDVDLSGVPSKQALCAINAHAKSSTVSELKVL